MSDGDDLVGRHRLDLHRRARVGRVDHLAVAHVDPHVARRARGAVRTREEEQIAGLRRGQAGDRRTDRGLFLAGPRQGDAQLAVHVLDEAGTVESRRARAAPDIGRPLEFLRLGHHVRPGHTTRGGGRPDGARGSGALPHSGGAFGGSRQVAERSHEQCEEVRFAARAPDARRHRFERIGRRDRGGQRRAERGGEVVGRRIGIGGDGIGEQVAGRPRAGRLGQAGREVVSGCTGAFNRGRRRRTDL